MIPVVEVVGAGLVLVVLVGGGYLKGLADAEAAAKAERLAAVERAIAQAAEQAAIDAEILRAHAARQQAMQGRAQRLMKAVVKHVEKPVYRDCRLDACGLCLAHAAAEGADGAACPCGPDDALPGPGGAGGREPGQPVVGLRGDGDPAACLYGSVPCPDGVAEE